MFFLRQCSLFAVFVLCIVNNCGGNFISATPSYDFQDLEPEKIGRERYADDVDEDFYFYTSPLRTKSDKLYCGSKIREQLCELNCAQSYICVDQECLCVEGDTFVKKLIQVEEPHSRAQSEPKDRDLGLTLDEEDDEDKHNLKQGLRHHIAHFCPNLEVARACIRTCIKVGKPAFCGKDHVCYCGHKYNQQTKDEGGDSNAMYEQFKDLYKKYFGDGYVPESIETS